MKKILKLTLFMITFSAINIAGIELHQYLKKTVNIPTSATGQAIKNIAALKIESKVYNLDQKIKLKISRVEIDLYKETRKRKRLDAEGLRKLVIERASRRFKFEKLKTAIRPSFATKNKIDLKEKYEINNRELIVLKKVETEIIITDNLLLSFKNFNLAGKLSEINKATNKKEEEISIADIKKSLADEVKLTQSATLNVETEKEINQIVNSVDLAILGLKKTEELDAPVFFDYSKDEEVVAPGLSVLVGTQKIEERPIISSTVSAAIKRELKKGTGKQTFSLATQKRARPASPAPPSQAEVTSPSPVVTPAPTSMSDLDKVVLMASSQKKGLAKNEEKKIDNEKLISSNIITVVQIGIDRGLEEKVAGFEVIDGANRNTRISDDGMGEVGLIENINQGEGGVYAGTIFRVGVIPTNFSIELEEGEYINQIPVFDLYEMNDFLDKEEIRDLGGYILIELDEKIDSVDIDKEFAAKIYLNEKYKVVDIDQNYRYILYVGVTPGNAMISYLNLKDEKLEKLSFVRESEVVFERTSTKRRKKIILEVNERKLLGSREVELDIMGDKISVFNKDILSRKVGINRYELIMPIAMKNTRRYFEFGHLKESVFLGAGGGDVLRVELPSTDYIEYVLGEFDLSDMSNICVVQVNLSRKALTLEVESENQSGPSNFELKFLDKDGEFSDWPTPLSEKAFLMSNGQGIFQVKIVNEDGTSSYLKTICSEGTYLIEQL